MLVQWCEKCDAVSGTLLWPTECQQAQCAELFIHSGVRDRLPGYVRGTHQIATGAAGAAIDSPKRSTAASRPASPTPERRRGEVVLLSPAGQGTLPKGTYWEGPLDKPHSPGLMRYFAIILIV
ncbi:hypothetical protein [Variovorax rhizosphaerae]|uniref:DUF35 domain-containing protein n=1 Tax=Variovorax rhizosphaerae TaxID=1836200 RepID=A0ABU8WWU1_9BURK